MPKLDEAREITAALGLPPAQQTTIAGYTLLALADLSERTPWSAAKRRSMKIHDIIVFVRTAYKKEYAENTRETFRRQVLHQFNQAHVVSRNPDEPTLPTNSPRTHYALSDAALRVVRAYGTPRFEAEARTFQQQQGSLAALYRAERKQTLIPVTLPSGLRVALTAGKHNALQAAVIEHFAPRFVPEPTVLYLGDAANKTLHVDVAALESLRVPVTKHDKLPDVVLYSQTKRWLFLIEAVTSHGPVSPKRFQEIEATLKDCPAERVYVSAFPDLHEFKRHLENVAWETEVWLAEIPDHMVHFNGERFLGPTLR